MEVGYRIPRPRSCGLRVSGKSPNCLFSVYNGGSRHPFLRGVMWDYGISNDNRVAVPRIVVVERRGSRGVVYLIPWLFIECGERGVGMTSTSEVQLTTCGKVKITITTLKEITHPTNLSYHHHYHHG